MLRFRSVGLLYTLTCPLQCRHCIVESSPKAVGKMDKSVAAAYLPAIRNHAEEICFTGGEPMLYFTEIVDLVAQAQELGLRPSMVSGAGWVRLDKAHIARDRMRALHQAGLRRLCISWDQYHEEWSPRTQAELLANIATEEGIEVVVRGVVAANHQGPRPETFFGQFKPQFLNLIRLGSATQLPDEQFQHMDMPSKGGCAVVLTPAIEPNGQVYACCGPSRHSAQKSPLILGNTNEEPLQVILDRAVEDPILNAMLLIGPVGLLKLIQKSPAHTELFRRRPSYNGVCDLCLDLMDSVELVAILRQRLSETDARALLFAAQALRHNRTQTEPPARLTPSQPQEVTHVA